MKPAVASTATLELALAATPMVVAYRIDDGTGTISVVSESGGAPRNGAIVGVEGTFRAAFTLGNQTAAVLLEKKRATQ